MTEPIRRFGAWFASWGCVLCSLLSLFLGGCPVDDGPAAQDVAAAAPQVERAAEALSVAGAGGPASRQAGAQSSPVAPATAATTTETATAGSALLPIADNGLRQASPFANNGTGKTMGVSATAGQQETGVLRFDQAAIAAAVAGKSVYSAKLKIAVTPTHSGWNGGKIAAHRMTRTWTERTGTTGATWRCAADTIVSNTIQDCTDANRWGMNTGDPDVLPYVAQATDTVRVYSDYFTIYLMLDVTADVRAFLSGTANHGWMLRVAPGGIVGTKVLVSTKEDSGFEPRLILDVGPDLCPSSSSKVAPEQCGCGSPDIDTDQDGIADCAEPSLVPSADSGIGRSFPYVNDGTGPYLGVATTRSSTGVERSLIRFDQAEIAAIAAGKVVTQAVLEMTVSWSPGGWTGGPIDVFPMNRTWAEGLGWDPGPGSTWDCASDPDTTTFNVWSSDCTAANRWNMENDPRPYSTERTARVAVFDSDTVVRFDVTADVRNFLTGTPNHGWLLVAPESPLDPGWLYFGSRETETPPRLRLTIDDQNGRLCNPNASNAQCGMGKVCRAGVADRFGLPASAAVCWPAECDDIHSPFFRCGTQNDLCGTCPACSSSCTGKACGSDGCFDDCGTCDAGESGCRTDNDCAAGLACGVNNGTNFGLTATADACWPSSCDLNSPCADPANAGRQTVCGKCPACVPNCTNPCDNGCGGTCSIPADAVCIGKRLMAQARVVDAPPPALAITTSTAGGVAGDFGVSHGGHASYSVPIQAPPGRTGMKPGLALQYSSGVGNGILGMGWRLDGLSRIHRCAKTLASDGVARALDMSDNDALCLDGQRLIEERRVQETGGVRREYHTELTDFSAIQGHFPTNGIAYFTVQTKAGLTMTFGRTNDSVIMLTDPQLFIIDVPLLPPSYPYLWALSRTEDRSGNAIEYAYENRADWTDYAQVHRHRIANIRYSVHASDPKAYAVVGFEYEPRPDFMQSMVWHNEIRTDDRLKRITTYSTGGTFQQYNLSYRDAGTGPYPTSQLTRVQHCAGTSSTTPVCRALPLQVNYEQEVPGLDAPQPSSLAGGYSNAYRHSLRFANNVVLDADGDGQDDLLVASSIVRELLPELGNRLVETASWSLLLNQTDVASRTRSTRAAPAYTLVANADGSPRAVPGSYVFQEWQCVENDPSACNIERTESISSALVGDYDNDGGDEVLVRRSTSLSGASRVLWDVTLTDFDAQGVGSSTLAEGLTTEPQPFDSVGLTALADLDGDRFPDHIMCQTVNGAAVWSYQLGSFSTTTRRYSFAALTTLQQNLGQPCPVTRYAPTQTLDLDGDGTEELLLNGSPEGNTSLTVCKAELGPVVNSPGLYCHALGVNGAAKPFDLNGDGLVDFYTVSEHCEPQSGVPVSDPFACRDDLSSGPPTGRYRTALLSTWMNTGDFAGTEGSNSFAFRQQELDRALWPSDSVLAFGVLPIGIYPQSRAAQNQSLGFDVDGDNRQDIVVPAYARAAGPNRPAVQGRWIALLSKADRFEVAELGVNLNWESYQSGSAVDRFLTERFVPADIDGDGVRDLLKSVPSRFDPEFSIDSYEEVMSLSWQAMYVRDASPRMSEVIDGLGERKTVSYLTDATELYTPAAVACVYPQLCSRTRQKLVASHTLWDRAGIDLYSAAQQWTYSYADGRGDRAGRGFLGFGSRTVQHSDAKRAVVMSTTQYDYDNRTRDTYRGATGTARPTGLYPFAGRPATVQTTYGSQYRNRMTTLYDMVRGPSTGAILGGVLVYPQLTTSTTEEVLAGSTAFTLLTTGATKLTLDVYGNIRESNEGLPSDGGGDDGTRIVTRRFKYEDDASTISSPALRDLVVEERVNLAYSKTATSPTGRTDARLTKYGYDAPGRLIRVEREPTASGTGTGPAEFYLRTNFDNIDAFGNVRKITTQGVAQPARVTTIAYDSAGLYPTSRTNALGQTTLLRYDYSHGLPTGETDPNGSRTDIYYDLFGRRVRELDANGGDIRTTYTDNLSGTGLQVQAQRVAFNAANPNNPGAAPAGPNLLEVYDEHGRLVGERKRGLAGKNLDATTNYDALGRVVSTDRPHSSDLDFQYARTQVDSYDALSRELSRSWVERTLNSSGVNEQRNLSETSCYRGLSSCTRDAEGYTRCQTTDARGRVVKTYDPAPDDPRTTQPASRPTCAAVLNQLGTNMKVTQYDYAETLERVVDAANRTRLMTPDRYGRTSKLTDADLGQVSYSYNGYDELVSLTDQNGVRSQYDYDLLGRQLRERFTKGTTALGTSDWTWDKDGPRSVAGDARFGALSTSRSIDGHSIEYGFDARGNTTRIQRTLKGQLPLTTTQSFDPVGRLDEVRFPVPIGTAPPAVSIRHTFDGYGALTNVAPSFGTNRTPYWTLSATNFYDEPSAEVFGDTATSGTSTSRGFDTMGRTQSIQTVAFPQGTPLQQLTYLYGPRGNLSRRSNTRAGITSQVEDFFHDGLNRLYSVRTNSQTVNDLTSYDGSGTLLSRTEVGTFTPDATHPHAIGRISNAVGGGTVTYGFDAGGNRISQTRVAGAVSTIFRTEYTPFNKPRAMFRQGATPTTRLEEVRYEYDADHGRMLKRAPSEVITYAGNYERREINGGGIDHVYLISNGERIVTQVTITQSATGTFSLPVVRYLHDDHLGSTDLVSNTAGQPGEERSYDAWGRRRDPRNWRQKLATVPVSSMHVGYTGHEDDSFGLINMGGRSYDPAIGQFLRADPHGGVLGASQSLNRYSYVWNNPLGMTDPTGYDALWEGSCASDSVCIKLYPNGHFASRVETAANGDLVVTGYWVPESRLPDLSMQFAMGVTVGAAAATAGIKQTIIETLIAEAGGALGWFAGKAIARGVGLASDAFKASRMPKVDIGPVLGYGLRVPARIPASRALPAVTRASSRALGRALESAGHVRPPGSVAHHIVAGGAKKAGEAQAALEKFGIGINDAANGAFLPSGVHVRIHTNAYYETVNSALRQATTRQEALQALDAIRGSLF
jgi:RHS repeat-associated protein